MRANQRTAAGHQSEYIRTAGLAAFSLPPAVFHVSGSPQERAMVSFMLVLSITKVMCPGIYINYAQLLNPVHLDTELIILL